MAKKTATKKAPAKAASAKKTATKKAASKTAAKPAAKKKAAPAKAKKKPAPVKAVAPAKKPAKASPEITSVVAKIDVGFGNKLFIRGDSPTLSWEKGSAMECSNSGDEWVWSTSNVKKSFECKVLVNDETWSTGGNISVKAGAKSVINPGF